MTKRLWKRGPLSLWKASATAFGVALEYQPSTYVRGWQFVFLVWDKRFVVRLYRALS